MCVFIWIYSNKYGSYNADDALFRREGRTNKRDTWYLCVMRKIHTIRFTWSQKKWDIINEFSTYFTYIRPDPKYFHLTFPFHERITSLPYITSVQHSIRLNWVSSITNEGLRLLSLWLCTTEMVFKWNHNAREKKKYKYDIFIEFRQEIPIGTSSTSVDD